MRSRRAHLHASGRKVSQYRKKGGKRAVHPRKTARGHQQSSAAKIFPPLDIQSKKHIADALKRIMAGPVTILLVYADWCSHCHDIMPHWDRAAQSPQRSVQSLKLNEKNTESFNEALRNINHNESSIHVSGYPTILVLDRNGKPVTQVEGKKDTAALTQLMNRSGHLAEQAGLSNPNMNHQESTVQEEQQGESQEEDTQNEGLVTKGDPRNVIDSFEPSSLPLAVPPPPRALIGGALSTRKARHGGLYRLLHPRTRRS